MSNLKKTKSGGKATKNVESICSSNEKTYLGIIMKGTNHISLNYLTLLKFFK